MNLEEAQHFRFELPSKVLNVYYISFSSLVVAYFSFSKFLIFLAKINSNEKVQKLDSKLGLGSEQARKRHIAEDF
jgi:hypothetical protein